VRVLSFGGGIQTTALAIMVAGGRAETDVMVFADTGSESPATYRHMESFEAWLRERGCEVVHVEAPVGPLYEYVWERSAVIPVRVGNNEGLGHRQCTRQWKITPILNYAKSLTEDRPIIMQLGISYDEIYRMKPSPDKGVVREWPLVDLKMTREDCRKVILDTGITEAPKSACYFCPLLPGAHFKRLAVEAPNLFEKAAKLEDRMNTRREGKKPVYLTATGKSLRHLQTGQMSLLAMLDGQEGAECEGSCFL
jgi:hypothetical protein